MDDHSDRSSPPLPIGRRALPEVPWVSLAEALTWIAFRDALPAEDLRAQVEGDSWPNAESNEERLRKFFADQNSDGQVVQGTGHFEDRQKGLESLSNAWRQLRNEVERGIFRVRGRMSPTYSLPDSRLANLESLTGASLAALSQFDVSTGGIRRQPHGSPDVLWKNDPSSFDREFASFGEDARAADGYLFVEVERTGLLLCQQSIGKRYSGADGQRIELAVKLATEDAKEILDRELAAQKAQLAANNGLGSSRRWIALAFSLETSARAYIDSLSAEIKAIENSAIALAKYTDSVEDFMKYLDGIYETEWARVAPWRLDKRAPPPTAWQSVRDRLKLAVQVQQARFAISDETANTMIISATSTPPVSKLAPKPRSGRTKGTGYQKADAPILEKMREAIDNDPSLNATSAARLFTDEAKGVSVEAKIDRLSRAYRTGNNKA
jgi:hypothetical protein